MTLKERAKQLKRDIPAVFLAFKHKQTPLVAKLLAGFVVVYALSPIDLIPDFIPVLGFLDDLILLPFLITITIKMIPKQILDECREQSIGLWEEKSPKRWFFAIPFILVWGLLMYWIVSTFIH